jgi:hypothetical protein
MSIEATCWIPQESLGSLAAPVVADRGPAAVWFTPLLTDEPTETDGADHAMFMPGPLTACTAVLGEVLTAVESSSIAPYGRSTVWLLRSQPAASRTGNLRRLVPTAC